LAGRPKIKITEEILEEVEQLAAQGLTQEQIADSLGWHRDTLYAKKRAYSEFSDAIKRGKAKGLKVITNNLFDQSGKGNVAATIFYLKNRDPDNWKDKVEIKSDQTINNIDERIKKRMKKLKQ
jgi:hypothetical protein